ncbi:hypothetical protein JQC92_12285 [Shewanella sp. 202IG2-18]|uniref:ribonuclease T2 family protein n=1 Tax=Parashewanella hymeniacidonis TaxID=2807618 RepID=UPI001960E8FD|nr:hypothetical protein [Parashewanella hymeniacidonis]MBM7072800.1 hypothetical protein [Parashewanella hymeniacidonis]
MNWLQSFTFTALTLLFSVNVLASEIGDFEATDVCPMFQSEAKQTNPDSVFSEPGNHYGIIEFQGSNENPSWVRVNTSEAHSPYRWIKGICGTSTFSSTPPSNGGGNSGSCHTTGEYDSHVLALSWQPGFCDTHGNGKPECDALKNGNGEQTASEFSLHGLWPNKDSCGKNYNFCGKETHEPFSDIKLSDDAVKAKLKELMPSTQYNSDLKNHEWWKHGTCQGGSPDEYFDLATSLVDRVNQSSFVTDFIQSNIGKTVSTDRFNQAFDQAFGENSHQHIALKCTSNQLVEMDIHLPKVIEKTQTLTDLLYQSSTNSTNSCPSNFEIKRSN